MGRWGLAGGGHQGVGGQEYNMAGTINTKDLVLKYSNYVGVQARGAFDHALLPPHHFFPQPNLVAAACHSSLLQPRSLRSSLCHHCHRCCHCRHHHSPPPPMIYFVCCDLFCHHVISPSSSGGGHPARHIRHHFKNPFRLSDGFRCRIIISVTTIALLLILLVLYVLLA